MLKEKDEMMARLEKLIEGNASWSTIVFNLYYLNSCDY
jgi:hypothetical protein